MTEERFDEWLETQPIEDKLVYLKYKYAHEDEWTFSNEILEVDMSVDGYYIWSHDWDEGQQDVEILGCIDISDIDVPVFTQADTPQTELWDKKSSDCDLWQKDSTCIGCYRYDICKQADTPQTETQIETQNKDGSGENMLLSALCKGFSIQDIIKDEPKYKDCNSCRYEDGDERCIPCSEGYSFYWKPKDEPQNERSK